MYSSSCYYYDVGSKPVIPERFSIVFFSCHVPFSPAGLHPFVIHVHLILIFLLLWTHTLTFCILHIFLISSFFTLSILVLPAILSSDFISQTSNILLVLAVSVLVSAAYVKIGRTAVLQMRTFASVPRNLLDQTVSFRHPDILDALIAWSLMYLLYPLNIKSRIP